MVCVIAAGIEKSGRQGVDIAVQVRIAGKTSKQALHFHGADFWSRITAD
jgi:hypothetical protein